MRFVFSFTLLVFYYNIWLFVVAVITDRETGEPKGFAFVNFENEQDAQDAVAGANGEVNCGKIIIYINLPQMFGISCICPSIKTNNNLQY